MAYVFLPILVSLLISTPGSFCDPSGAHTVLCAVAEQYTLMLYYTPNCPYSQKVLKYLKANQIEIPMKNVKEDKVGRKELLEKGGKLQVPCLLVNGTAIYDSEAIIEWLATHRGE